MKRLFSFLLMLVLIMSVMAVVTVPAGAAVTLNADEITLYAMDGYAEEYISIPDDYPQSFQLVVSGAKQVHYSCVGYSAQVSDTGLITPKIDTWYWYDNIGYSYQIEGREPSDVTRQIKTGDSTVYIYADNQRYEVKVTVKDYAQEYADGVMRNYLDEHITPDMTTYEKMCVIGQFIGSYKYSVYEQSTQGMIITGGGDCWASANTAVAMAKMLGFEAWLRNGYRDPGAGSNHRNAIVYDGEKYYVVEAGYSMPVPRLYTVKEIDSPFSYYYDSENGGIEVYQYDGPEMPETLTVPGTINGQPVTAIAERFLVANTDVKTVVLPDSIRRIGDGAFNSCSSLQSINLPASLNDLGDFVFTYCNALTDISSNGDFTVSDGAIYRDGVLLYAPAVSVLNIPDGVTEIAPYALYYNENVTSAKIPETVEKIGEGAFAYCSNLESLRIRGEGLKEIEGYVVANTALSELGIPASADTLDADMMAYAGDTTLVVVPDSTAEQFAKDNNIPYRYVVVRILGDADGDGTVSATDVTMIQRKLSGLATTSFDGTAADADEDETVSILDATVIQRYLAGMTANEHINKPVSV
ncbi:MAG: leucine-rich repeat protein [Ruminococcus sp.]|nr:leucine-rich repeat protein [Ruminococcus sp.]